MDGNTVFYAKLEEATEDFRSPGKEKALYEPAQISNSSLSYACDRLKRAKQNL